MQIHQTFRAMFLILFQRLLQFVPESEFQGWHSLLLLVPSAGRDFQLSLPVPCETLRAQKLCWRQSLKRPYASRPQKLLRRTSREQSLLLELVCPSIPWRASELLVVAHLAELSSARQNVLIPPGHLLHHQAIRSIRVRNLGFGPALILVLLVVDRVVLRRVRC